MIIGLTGLREVGKSTIARILREQYGFASVHGFGPGRDMCVAHYRACGIDEDTARRMVYGDLKDTPCSQLPNGVSSRFFMEKLGRFMGQELGPDWTVGVEIARELRQNPKVKLVAESLVYEGRALIARCDIRVVRVVRSNHRGVSTEYTDLNQQDVPYHYWLDNCTTVAELEAKVARLISTLEKDTGAYTPLLDSRPPLNPLREIHAS